MKAVDTNVLVRVLTRDDPEQARAAAEVMRSGPVFIACTVLLETEWVLRHAYGFDRAEIGRALRALVDLTGVVVDGEAAVRSALAWHASGIDLADALHLARSADADELVTFDRRFAKRAEGVARVRLLG